MIQDDARPNNGDDEKTAAIVEAVLAHPSVFRLLVDDPNGANPLDAS